MVEDVLKYKRNRDKTKGGVLKSGFNFVRYTIPSSSVLLPYTHFVRYRRRMCDFLKVLVMPKSTYTFLLSCPDLSGPYGRRKRMRVSGDTLMRH
jgi:hypothetical protein